MDLNVYKACQVVHWNHHTKWHGEGYENYGRRYSRPTLFYLHNCMLPHWLRCMDNLHILLNSYKFSRIFVRINRAPLCWNNSSHTKCIRNIYTQVSHGDVKSATRKFQVKKMLTPRQKHYHCLLLVVQLTNHHWLRPERNLEGYCGPHIHNLKKVKIICEFFQIGDHKKKKKKTWWNQS